MGEMATTTNADRVRTYFTLVDANDLAGVYDLYADSIVYRRAGLPPIVGKRALVDFFEGPRGIRSIRHEIEISAVDGPCVVAEGRARAQLTDGGSFDLRFVDLFWFDDGLVVRRHGYMDIAP